MPTPSSMQIEGFYDDATSTVSYLVLDRATRDCALIDSVLDYDPKSGHTSTASAERLVRRVRALEARVVWILETHVHADHLSAAPFLQAELGGRIGIGSHITSVQQVFGKLFNTGHDFQTDGSQFDHLIADDEQFALGSLTVHAMHTPGHTPACMTYVVSAPTTAGPDNAAAAFVGDTLFMPDHGTARCDFPGGDARTLYRSIAKVLRLPPQTLLYMCHDYQPGGRAVKFVCTVAEAKAENVQVHDGISEESFVTMRHERDATLAMPTLILPAVQVNMRAGHMPAPEANGTRYLKIPINVL
jgi:glyoxylase-like metal-dependent hydrolase (beta-lactamase superfamily II)